MNITNKQKLVLRAINMQPKAADDDALLIATVWKLEGWDDFGSLEHNLRRVTRPETICRRRRELFNIGLINYSESASKRRMTAYKNERNIHSNYIPRSIKEIIAQEGLLQ